mmetsp:Transcript_53853/g.99537  ORF Transcript_53853/g.99537 Transcript_53853/m.99537 type:complete len:253 (+) Transcript_53853:108-866(+)
MPDESRDGPFHVRSLLGATEQEVIGAWTQLGAEHSQSTGTEWSCKTNVDSKTFKECRYLNAKTLGLSVRLQPAENGIVDVIFLYNQGVQGFEQYKAGPLPEELTWSDVGRDVVQRFGEPSDKFGGGRLAVGISYDTLGLDVHFVNNTWEDAENPISFIGVFAGVDQCSDLCIRCAKRAKFHCGRCKQRRYCSSKCQAADWPAHKSDCFVVRRGTSEGLGGPRLQELEDSQQELAVAGTPFLAWQESPLDGMD